MSVWLPGAAGGWIGCVWGGGRGGVGLVGCVSIMRRCSTGTAAGRALLANASWTRTRGVGTEGPASSRGGGQAPCSCPKRWTYAVMDGQAAEGTRRGTSDASCEEEWLRRDDAKGAAGGRATGSGDGTHSNRLKLGFHRCGPIFEGAIDLRPRRLDYKVRRALQKHPWPFLAGWPPLTSEQA